MKKVHLEILFAILFVLISTYYIYDWLVGISFFWNAQMVWSVLLAMGWVIVSLGYFRQGWLVHHSGDAREVSVLLPIAAFTAQCVLFVKGIFYHDWSLIAGALMVNSGVVFSLYNIFKAKLK